MKNKTSMQYYIGDFDNHGAQLCSYLQSEYRSTSDQNKQPSTLAIYSDTFLKTNSPHRPLFPLDWRIQDACKLKTYDEIIVINDQMNYDFLLNRMMEKSQMYLSAKDEFLMGVVDKYPSIKMRTTVLPQAKVTSLDVISNLAKTQVESKCFRRQVSAVLLRNGMLVAKSCNGALSAEKNDCARCQNMGSSKDVPCKYGHAEARCCEYAMKGDTIISTLSPCENCAKKIVQSGISRVVFSELYSDTKPLRILNLAGVEYFHRR